MENGLEVSHKHSNIVENAEPDYGFNVVAWERDTLGVEGSVRESAFIESEGNDASYTEQERHKCVPRCPRIHNTTYVLSVI
jgi:hypothetical protein